MQRQLPMIRFSFFLLFIFQFSQGWTQIRQISFAHSFGAEQSEKLFSVENTLDTGYIMWGYTETFGAGNKDMLLTKMDKRGDIKWSYAYGDSQEDIAKHSQG